MGTYPQPLTGLVLFIASMLPIRNPYGVVLENRLVFVPSLAALRATSLERGRLALPLENRLVFTPSLAALRATSLREGGFFSLNSPLSTPHKSLVVKIRFIRLS